MRRGQVSRVILVLGTWLTWSLLCTAVSAADEAQHTLVANIVWSEGTAPKKFLGAILTRLENGRSVVVDDRAISKNGCFEFRDLAAGSYVLEAMERQIPALGYEFSNSVTLGKELKTTIDLKVRKPEIQELTISVRRKSDEHVLTGIVRYWRRPHNRAMMAFGAEGCTLRLIAAEEYWFDVKPVGTRGARKLMGPIVPTEVLDQTLLVDVVTTAPSVKLAWSIDKKDLKFLVERATLMGRVYRMEDKGKRVLVNDTKARISVPLTLDTREGMVPVYGLKDGQYEVRLGVIDGTSEAAMLASEGRTAFVVRNGRAQPDVLNMAISRAGTGWIDLQVTGPAGDPPKDVFVGLECMGNRFADVRTDSAGRYVSPRLLPGKFTAVLVARGLPAIIQEIDVLPGRNEISASWRDVVEVRAQISDSRGGFRGHFEGQYFCRLDLSKPHRIGNRRGEINFRVWKDDFPVLVRVLVWGDKAEAAAQPLYLLLESPPRQDIGLPMSSQKPRPIKVIVPRAWIRENEPAKSLWFLKKGTAEPCGAFRLRSGKVFQTQVEAISPEKADIVGTIGLERGTYYAFVQEGYNAGVRPVGYVQVTEQEGIVVDLTQLPSVEKPTLMQIYAKTKKNSGVEP
jgi:hypothetical protein